MLAQAREGNTVLRVLGDHPDDKASIEICSGRYGPYVRHGKINATLPKNVSPDAVTMEMALELIAAKAAKGGKGSGKAGKSKLPATKSSRPNAKQKTTKPKASAAKGKVSIKAAKPAAKKSAAAGKTVKSKTAAKGKVL